MKRADHFPSRTSTRPSYLVQPLVRGQAAEPNAEKRRALFERSELRSLRIRLRGAGDPKGRARAQWFCGLLPKQKALVHRGETRHIQKKLENWMPVFTGITEDLRIIFRYERTNYSLPNLIPTFWTSLYGSSQTSDSS